MIAFAIMLLIAGACYGVLRVVEEGRKATTTIDDEIEYYRNQH